MTQEEERRTAVVWDFQTRGLWSLLADLGPEVDVSGPERLVGGEILGAMVKRLKARPRVLAFVDHPNINVGFEIGLAFGLDRSIAFAAYSETKPDWLLPPFSSWTVTPVAALPEVKNLLAAPGAFCHLDADPSDVNSATTDTLFLCGTKYEGSACDPKAPSEWLRPATPSNYAKLPGLTEGIDRLFLTIGSNKNAPSHPDRDSPEDVANAVIAGWFYATRVIPADKPHRLLARSASSRWPPACLHVLRSVQHRELANLAPLETVFMDATDFERKLGRLASKETRPLERSSQSTAREPNAVLPAPLSAPERLSAPALLPAPVPLSEHAPLSEPSPPSAPAPLTAIRTSQTRARGLKTAPGRRLLSTVSIIAALGLAALYWVLPSRCTGPAAAGDAQASETTAALRPTLDEEPGPTRRTEPANNSAPTRQTDQTKTQGRPTQTSSTPSALAPTSKPAGRSGKASKTPRTEPSSEPAEAAKPHQQLRAQDEFSKPKLQLGPQDEFSKPKLQLGPQDEFSKPKLQLGPQDRFSKPHQARAVSVDD